MEVFDVLKTPKARLNFLKGLIRIAKVDQKIDDQELVFYQSAAKTFELEESELESLKICWEGNEKIDIEFETNREKMFFFVQAVQLCWIDNNYADTEREEIRKIAEEFRISKESVKAVEDWVYEGMVWNRKGDKLLDLE